MSDNKQILRQLNRLIRIALLFFTLAFCDVSFAQPDANLEEEPIESLIKRGEKQTLTAKESIRIAQHYVDNQQYINSLAYSNKSVEICEETKDTTQLVRALNVKAGNLHDLGRYEEGLQFCEEKSKLFRPQDSIQLEFFCFKWGMFYYSLGEYEKAYKTYRKITTEKNTNLGIYNTNISIIHAALGNYDSAYYYLKKNINSDDPMDNDNYSKGVRYHNLGYYAALKKEYEKAINYYDSSYYYRIRDTAFGNSASLKSLFENYYEAYRRMGLIDEAFRVQDSIGKFNEMLFQERLEEEFEELKLSYERERNLQNKVEIGNLKIVSYRKQIVFWSISIGCLILAIISYFAYRNLKNKSKLLALEQKLLRSQMTPHFIFNSMSVLQGMILNHENTKAVNYLSKFSKLMRLVLENSRTKLVVLNDEIEAVEHYMALQKLQMEKPLSYSVSIDETIDTESILIPTMMIQPFVENAIQHGFSNKIESPEITIQLVDQGTFIVYEITDNGLGLISTSEKLNHTKKSLSTEITKERLELLSKVYKMKFNMRLIDLETEQKQGTKVTLSLPKILI